MQAGAEIDDIENAKRVWLAARDQAITVVESLVLGFNLHKQIANRLLEPWAHINVVLTATDFQNWWALRRHPDAQPEIKELADAMFRIRSENEPRLRKPGYWHLPYVRADECLLDLELQKKISVARCARVSYLTHDGRQTSPEEDIQLYDRLVGSHPLHASPAEHQATPDAYEIKDEAMAGFAARGTEEKYAWHPAWQQPELHGNFNGWIQLRKTLPGEFTPG
jgi:hypothetical protein